MTFDAGEECGTYLLSNIAVISNDPFTPEFIVPAEMRITGEPAIAVSDTILDFGRVFLGGTTSDSLMVINPGCDLLSVTGLSMDAPQFSLDDTPFDLEVDASRTLVVSISPDQQGPLTGTLSIVSNDPIRPLVVIHLMADVQPAPDLVALFRSVAPVPGPLSAYAPAGGSSFSRTSLSGGI